MAFGDFQHDQDLRDAWHGFCDKLKRAGDLVFKDYTPPTSLQRADGFRFLTQALSQAFDLALETRDTRFPMLHAFCGPQRKLGGDNADFIYLQAWIDGKSAYKITGNKGTARFMNFTVQGPRPEKDAYYGADVPSLHEPFGDTPEANIFGHELKYEWDGSFVLYIGGPQRGPNWLPTTPGSRKLFLRQGFDSWDEEPAEFRIERLDMEGPRPVPTHETIVEAVHWAEGYLLGAMRDWPDFEVSIKGHGLEEKDINRFPPGDFPADAETRDQRRGRFLRTMRWRLASDEAMIIEFDDYDGFWMFTNMGTFWNSMDYLYRPISYTPSRTSIDSDGKVRIVMAHEDPGYFNWLDTQGFTHGFLRHSSVLSRTSPMLGTKIVKARELAQHLPEESGRISPGERLVEMQRRFDAIRRRYQL
jgi:hypothetical protein